MVYKTIVYSINEALRACRQAKMMTFMSVITVAFALVVMGSIAIGYINVRGWFKDAANRVEAVAFLQDTTVVQPAAVTDILSRIRAFPQVASATYVNKEQAWQRFKETYGTSMLSAVDDNPFPASIEIALTENAQSTQSTQALQSMLERIPGIEEIQISQQWILFMQRLKQVFLIGSISLAVMLMLALHFMIANTIKLTIYARQDVIRNMRYVGATKWFIRMPYIVEGLLQGIGGGVIAIVVLAGTKVFIHSHLNIYWGPWYSFLFILFTGALFGCIGSLSGVRKFLA